jgi:hypothetical protein
MYSAVLIVNDARRQAKSLRALVFSRKMPIASSAALRYNEANQFVQTTGENI